MHGISTTTHTHKKITRISTRCMKMLSFIFAVSKAKMWWQNHQWISHMTKIILSRTQKTHTHTHAFNSNVIQSVDIWCNTTRKTYGMTGRSMTINSIYRSKTVCCVQYWQVPEKEVVTNFFLPSILLETEKMLHTCVFADAFWHHWFRTTHQLNRRVRRKFTQSVKQRFVWYITRSHT